MSFPALFVRMGYVSSILHKRWHWLGAAFLIGLLSYLPVRLMIATLQAPNPKAILTLGGGGGREAFTAEFATTHPDLNIWISSGMEVEKADRLFHLVGVDRTRVHYDRQAIDTVTNFTTLVDILEQNHIRHVYLVTCDFHMPRAIAIATIILGHRGIRFTPVIVPSNKPYELPLRIARDVTRAILWMFTSYTGAGFRSQTIIARLNYKIFGSNDEH